jgi:hypothetical protein
MWSRFLFMSAREADDLRAAIDPLTLVKPGRGSSSRWAARVTQRMARLDVAASFVLAVGVDVCFSVYEDVQMRDIYGLTDQQIVYRAAVRGLGGGISAGIVMGLGWVVLGEVFPPLWFAIPVLLCAELFYEQLAVPTVYSRYGLYGSYEPRVHHSVLDPGSLDRRRFVH